MTETDKMFEELGFKKEEINSMYKTYLVYKSKHKVGTGEPYFDYKIIFGIPKDIRQRENITCEILSMWNGSETLPIDFELSKAIYKKMCELKGVSKDEEN